MPKSFTQTSRFLDSVAPSLQYFALTVSRASGAHAFLLPRSALDVIPPKTIKSDLPFLSSRTYFCAGSSHRRFTLQGLRRIKGARACSQLPLSSIITMRGLFALVLQLAFIASAFAHIYAISGPTTYTATTTSSYTLTFSTTNSPTVA